ncbi:hypothetical protein BDQ94DRAFT_58020 [Aspergillus welwitschiae]|uniref:Uncharacterized protein n=1 Tax=Aspergillus welwitschiae TaxID=1341132 RepID=A0A3F3PXC4_9EURO|nr:hypothetical protein BDQ94DRAFT_58020 [Aspergillus welwitschiae]RDH31521.1 hypothetical protein BDQ94DRAFT_58020 [Aspergillus welwitschiae]
MSMSRMRRPILVFHSWVKKVNAKSSCYLSLLPSFGTPFWPLASAATFEKASVAYSISRLVWFALICAIACQIDYCLPYHQRASRAVGPRAIEYFLPETILELSGIILLTRFMPVCFLATSTSFCYNPSGSFPLCSRVGEIELCAAIFCTSHTPQAH